jgi:hypothetical protein
MVSRRWKKRSPKPALTVSITATPSLPRTA